MVTYNDPGASQLNTVACFSNNENTFLMCLGKLIEQRHYGKHLIKTFFHCYIRLTYMLTLSLVKLKVLYVFHSRQVLD